MKIYYKIEFFSYWHAGSGLSVAGDVDAAVLKDKQGLPYLPGKTLKGLLRDAAEQLLSFGRGSQEQVQKIFGLETAKQERSKEEKEEEIEGFGQAYFSNALLADDLVAQLQALVPQGNYTKKERDRMFKQVAAPILYSKIASTAIDDETGTAQKSTLRKMEVAVPMVFFAHVDHVTEEDKPFLLEAMQMVKRMGVQRHRGLGRCEFSILA